MSTYQRINLDTLVQRLTERSGPIFWTYSEKRRALNEALRVWACMTGQWSRRFSLPTTGDIFYDVPTQIVSLQRIKYNTTTLYQTSLPELDYGVANWQQAPQGTPSLWAPIGLNKVAIYPPPPLGGFLNLEGLTLAPALNVGGDFIDIGDEEVTRILDYAHHILTFKEGGVEFQSSTSLMANFVAAAAERNARLLGAAIFKRYLGLDKAQEQRPVRSVEQQNIGARS